MAASSSDSSQASARALSGDGLCGDGDGGNDDEDDEPTTLAAALAALAALVLGRLPVGGNWW
jgi:hypothetical protein